MGTSVWRRGRSVSGMRRAVTLLLMAFFCIAGAASARGQAVKGQIVSVGLGGEGAQSAGGVYRVGSWVPLKVHLENRSPTPFEGHLGVEQIDLDGDKALSVGPAFVLQPTAEGRTLWTYYWPTPNDSDFRGVSSVVILDKDGQTVVGKVSMPDAERAARGIGNEDQERLESTRLVVVLGKRQAYWNAFGGAYGGNELVESIWLQDPSQLPDDVKGLDGVDVVVWQADTIKPSELSPDFQLKALLEWVKAGGHLIITVGTQAQEFTKAGEPLTSALPLKNLSTRDLHMSDLTVFRTLSVAPFRALDKDDKPLVQVIGELQPAGRPVIGGVKGRPTEIFADHPLVVTGLYGRGAVTMVTIDASDPEINAKLAAGAGGQETANKSWMLFWSAAAGWPLPDKVFTARDANMQNVDVAPSSAKIELGRNISAEVDVRDVTEVRVLVAVLFLALYWLIAGPLGHAVLRSYKVVHWSWWIFGGIVLAATSVAGIVVFYLHVSTYDVRHRSFVLGTVGSDEVTVDSFYGIYAPTSGAVEIKQKAGEGMNYLAPLCMPTTDEVKPYADPQSYSIWSEHSAAVSPVFRSTLKKMQGRWTGHLGGISGSAQYTRDPEHVLRGTLTNNTGYTLEDAEIEVYFPSLEPPNWAIFRNLDWHGATPGATYRFTLGRQWKPGESIDLEKSLTLQLKAQGTSFAPAAGAPKVLEPGHVEDLLEVAGWGMSQAGEGSGSPIFMTQESITSLADRTPWNPHLTDAGFLMNFLADERNPDPLRYFDHRSIVRGFERVTDCTKELHAAGALLLARAGDINNSDFVRSPVALSVNNRNVDGKGDVQFAYALVVTGDPPPTMRITAAGAPAAPAGAAPNQGGRGNLLLEGQNP